MVEDVGEDVGAGSGGGRGVMGGTVRGENERGPGDGLCGGGLIESGDGSPNGAGGWREGLNEVGIEGGAVGGVGSDDVLAAGDGAIRVNGARFVFEEGAGDVEGEIATAEFVAVFLGHGWGLEEAVEEAGVLEFKAGVGEALAEASPGG